MKRVHTPPPTFRRSSVSKSQRHPSCGLMLMTKHIRNEVQGGGQIGGGAVAEGVGWGKPVRWNWRRRVAPTASCAWNGAALPRAGWAPVQETTS